jgi:hypothetical protein
MLKQQASSGDGADGNWYCWMMAVDGGASQWMAEAG